MTEIINLRTFSLNQWHPFDILPDLELDQLYQSLKVENRKTGETIFDVGESVDFLYIIVSGSGRHLFTRRYKSLTAVNW